MVRRVGFGARGPAPAGHADGSGTNFETAVREIVVFEMAGDRGRRDQEGRTVRRRADPLHAIGAIGLLLHQTMGRTTGRRCKATGG
jgi:hypothetical protein